MKLIKFISRENNFTYYYNLSQLIELGSYDYSGVSTKPNFHININYASVKITLINNTISEGKNNFETILNLIQYGSNQIIEINCDKIIREYE